MIFGPLLMNSEELLLEEIYRLKNQISDLKNALDLNRDVLKIVTEKESDKENKMSLLYKIIYRLTTQSNEALTRNAELINQKNQLKIEFNRVIRQLEEVQSRLQAEIKRNSFLESPTLSKMAMQQQFTNLNNHLLASHEQKIHLQHQVDEWKARYYELQQKMAQKYNQLKMQKQGINHSDQTGLEEVLEEIPLKKSKLSRKYTCNRVIEQDQKRTKLEKQNRKLKYYIQELEQRIILFIKAYDLEENILQRRKSSHFLRNKHPLQSAQNIQINLIKYAINEISLEERENELYLRIKKTFLDSEQNAEIRRQRRNVHSYPKHKEYQISQETSDSGEFKVSSNFLSENWR